MQIEKYEVNSTIEAPYWINKIWKGTKSEEQKEELSKQVLEYLSENIIEQM